MDHFGPGIDLLDIHTEGEGVVNFACYTEKDYKLSNDASVYCPVCRSRNSDIKSDMSYLHAQLF